MSGLTTQSAELKSSSAKTGGQGVELFRLRYSSYVKQLNGFADDYNKAMRGKMPKVVLSDAYYRALENSGKLFAIGARCDGRLVGVISFLVTVSAHYSHDYRIAKHDFHYVDPKHRHGLLPMRMLNFAEHTLQELGIRRIFYVDHVRFQDRSAAMRRMGYSPVEVTYEKILTPKSTRGGHASTQGS